MLRVKFIEKHGLFKIRWFRKGINSNARERAVVIHGADYVSDSFIQNKRLGKFRLSSNSCELTDKIIKTIKDKSCLFIYYPSSNYKVTSRLFINKTATLGIKGLEFFFYVKP
jgi:hypothetical protein